MRILPYHLPPLSVPVPQNRRPGIIVLSLPVHPVWLHRQPRTIYLYFQSLVDRLLAEQGQIRENYLRYLTGRIRFLSGRLQALAQPGAEGKLARYLLSGGGGELTCSATQLSQRLGLSRASLYRAFAALEENGLITRRGKTITVADPAGLEAVL